MFQAVNDKIQIFLTFIGLKETGLIIGSKICVTKYMEKLKLDSLNVHGIKVTDCFQDIFTTFPRKSQDCMNDYLNVTCAETFYRVVKTGKRVATPDILCSIFVNGLKSELDPYRLDPVQGIKKFHHIISQTVRPGSDG